MREILDLKHPRVILCLISSKLRWNCNLVGGCGGFEADVRLTNLRFASNFHDKSETKEVQTELLM